MSIWFHSSDGVNIEFPRGFVSKVPFLLEASSGEVPVSYWDLKVIRAICAFKKKPYKSQSVIISHDYESVDEMMQQMGMTVDTVASGDDFVDMVRYLDINITDTDLVEAVADIGMSIDYDESEEAEKEREENAECKYAII
jgi:hypothetical protein